MKNIKRLLAWALVLCMVLGVMPLGIFAVETAGHMATKPADGTTQNEPFPQGAGGSNSFRIPALVTLSDGTLVAAADARWNTTYDGGGLDTIVSVSKDNGANWSYTFANYMGDNGNQNNASSTAFIDPALVATADDTIYMLVDLYPYGVALNGGPETYPVTTKGFNDAGKLLLTDNNFSSFNYYLDQNADGTYTIYSTAGAAVTKYTVDAYFNVYDASGSYVSNLFFSDSPYKVVRTGYLYLTKSTDGGATWSAPELLNLKTSSEQVCLVAPGRGLVTSNGNIIFPVYSYKGSQESQTMSFISYDGESWSRSTSMTGAAWSSESAVVELEGGGLRFFYRNGTTNLCYVDYNNGWRTPVVMSDIDTNSNCQISAITYSKTINGKQVILVSCPTGPNEAGSNQSSADNRLNGKIFAFTVEADGSMTEVGSVNVSANENQFMYSCLTELADGTVGILYEDCENAWGTGSNCYYTMEYKTYDLKTAMGLTFDAETTEPETTEPEVTEPETTEPEVTEPETTEPEVTEPEVSVTDEGVTITEVKEVVEIPALTTDFVAYEVTLNKDGGNYTGAATITLPLNGKFAQDAELWGFVLETDGTVTYVKENVVHDAENDTVTFTAPHFSTVGAMPKAADVTIENEVDVRIPVGGTSQTYTVDGVYVESLPELNTDVATATLDGDPGSESTATYTAVSVRYNALGASTSWTKTSYYYPVSGQYYPVYAYYTSSYWTTYYYGYSTTDSSNNVTQIGYGNANTSINVYTKSGTEAVPAKTTVSFKGVSAGTTTAVVGSTQYNITVYEEKSITVNYVANGSTVKTETITVASDATTATLPATVLGTDGNTYMVGTTLTLTAGTTAYTVPVTLVEGEEVTVAAGKSLVENLDVTLSDGQYVVWESADTSKVTVGADYASDGSVTNHGTIIGQAVTTDSVLVTATVYNANGTVASVHKWLVTVTEGAASTNTTSKYIYLNIDRIQNCTVYYNINGGELIQITDDMLEGPYTDANGTYYKLKVALMDEQYTGGFQISFFAAPDEGYALTYMSSTNSAGQYYIISNGNPDGVGSSAWPFVDGYDYDSFDDLSSKPAGGNTNVFDTSVGVRWGLVEGNFTVAELKVMYANAIALGCDGTLVFTKNNNGTTNGSTNNFGDNDLVSTLSFVAQKLPEMEKKLVSITHSDDTTVKYTDGMNIVIGDTLNYEIYIYSPVTKTVYGNITYTNIKLVDELTGDTWATTSNQTVSSTNTTVTTIADSVSEVDSFTYVNSAGDTITYNGTTAKYVYETSLTLGAGNFLSVVHDGYITNTADLTYTYNGQYSVGASTFASNAIAEVVVVVPEYVIDFGAPVVIDLTDDPLVEGDKITEAKAKYGTVEITGDRKFTYTPSTILQGNDFITLTFEEDKTQAIIGYGVRILPATTVYYEEGFMLETNSGWSGGSKNTGNQTPERLGEKVNVYGYDGLYATNLTGSNGTNATTSAIGAQTTFTFTGTGFDLYANCTGSTGYVTVQIKDANGNSVKLYMVNTKVASGSTGATTGQTGSFYSLPIVSHKGLEHGTYTVTVRKVMDDNAVNIDGVRIYNTLKDSSVFTVDNEDKPDFYELRDMVLNALTITDGTSQDYGTLSQMAQQVYNQVAGATAIITGESVSYPDGSTAQDLLDNGPKNELYLHKNEVLTFSVTTDRMMQIGLKAPVAATSAKITVTDEADKTVAIGTSVDMFYDLGVDKGTEKTYTVTITNQGDNILAVTNLKICDDPNVTFNPLTVEDIEAALVAMGYTDEPEVTEPEVTEPEVTEPEVTEPEVTEPEVTEPEVTEPEVTEPEVTEPEVTEPEVTEPEVTEPEVTEPEVVYADAVLNVTLVDYRGRSVASAQITLNGVQGEKAVFTAEEVMAAVKAQLPEGYALVDESAVTAVEVLYGQVDTVSIQAGKVATLTVTFVNFSGRKVGTATLTKVQTSSGSCKFTASEIRAAAPAGKMVLRLSSKTVSYGSSASITVTVF